MADFQDRILVANELGLAPAARGAPPYFCRWYCVAREVTAGNLISHGLIPPRSLPHSLDCMAKHRAEPGKNSRKRDVSHGISGCLAQSL
jgi:hypothetical protein